MQIHAQEEHIASKETIHEVMKFICGSTASAISKTVVYPLDRVKMIYQVKGTVNGVPFSVYSKIKHVVRHEGILKLWKGNLSAVARVVPYGGVVFFTFDKYQKRMAASSFFKDRPSVQRVVAGGLAGSTAVLITYPLDVWNTRMAVSVTVSSYSQVTMLKQEGFRALFKGVCPTLIGIFPYAGVSFLTFETLKEFLSNHFVNSSSSSASHTSSLSSNSAKSLSPSSNMRVKDAQLPSHLIMFCGACGGLVSQTVTYPIDTVRKRLQTKSFLHAYRETFSHTQTASTAPAPDPCSSSARDVSMVKNVKPMSVTYPVYSVAAATEYGVFDRIVRSHTGLYTQAQVSPTISQTISKLSYCARNVEAEGVLGKRLWRCVRDVYAEGGAYAFYRGVSVNWFKGPLSVGLSFTLHDILMNKLKSY
eukprot:GHVR01180354.1.p1 GENE.GHVR01180354.1~~GHVR01180354.1.p1  ORF type:complete len:419 (+),score=72.18 GHVR01180354.1:55-1311(+)